jgi:hypothetical protein
MTVTIDLSNGTGVAISNDVTNLTIATPRTLQDVTGVNMSAVERLALLGDGQVSLNGVFNDAPNMSHLVLKDVGTNSNTRTVAIAVSGQTCTVECLFGDYALTHGTDGSLTWTTTGQECNGVAATWS